MAAALGSPSALGCTLVVGFSDRVGSTEERLQEQAENVRSSVAEMDKTREKGQVRGMAISKKAVEGTISKVVRGVAHLTQI